MLCAVWDGIRLDLVGIAVSTAIICPHIAVDMQAVGRITEILKKVEEAGFEEVILYFNVGLKPHSQVKEEMARFAAEIAPAFTVAASHKAQ